MKNAVMCREAFEQTEYCLDENQGEDGIYLDELTAINWLIWLVSWTVTTWQREGSMSPFTWQNQPSQAIKPHRMARKPNLAPKRLHIFAAATPAPLSPPLTDEQVKGADSMWGTFEQ